VDDTVAEAISGKDAGKFVGELLFMATNDIHVAVPGFLVLAIQNDVLEMLVVGKVGKNGAGGFPEISGVEDDMLAGSQPFGYTKMG